MAGIVDKEFINRIEECSKMAGEISLGINDIEGSLELTDEVDAGADDMMANLLSLIKLVRKEAETINNKASELELKISNLKDGII